MIILSFFLIPVIIFLIIKLVFYFRKKKLLTQYYNNAVLFLDSEKFEELIEYSYKMLKLFPENFHIHYYLATSYAYLNDPENAVPHIEKSLAINSKFSDAHYTYGYISNFLLGKPDQAVEHLQMAISLNSSNENYYNTLSAAYSELNRFDDAEAAVENALKINPDFIDGLNNKGVIQLKKGKIFDAIKTFKHACGINGSDSELLCNLGNAYSIAQEYDDAVKCFNSALKYKEDSYIYYWLGSAEYLSGKTSDAVNHFNKSIELDPNNAHSYYLLALIYQKNGDTASAKLHWDKALAIDPEIKNKVII
ncbi:tetratricopeptide repeat protein [Candidatus Dependentiae bacterium]|nr:tetratricopeptide repeat protein [Candidatus Dependentiae bacterium]